MLIESIQNQNIIKALEIVHEDELPPVFIPSYKNRKGTIINRLDEIPSEVHLFIYDDDRENYPETFSDNVIVHEISKKDFEEMNLEWRGICPKREYMLEFAKRNNIPKIIMLDDDISFDVWYADKARTTSVSNTKAKCSIWDGFRLLLRLAEKENWGVLGFTMCELRCSHYNLKKILNENAYPCGAVVLNVEKLSDIHYSQTFGKFMMEDLSIDIECLKRNLKILVSDFMYFKTLISTGGKNSIASNKNVAYKSMLNSYIEYRDFMFLKISKKGELRVAINHKNIYNNISIINDEFHEKLYQACIKSDVEEVFELLRR